MSLNQYRMVQKNSCSPVAEMSLRATNLPGDPHWGKLSLSEGVGQLIRECMGESMNEAVGQLNCVWMGESVEWGSWSVNP